MKSHCVEELTIRYLAPDVCIEGPLTQETVMSALSQCTALLPKQTPVTFNLKGVTDCDSASLALLIALMRVAKAGGNELRFSNVPKQMMDLSQVSGLTGIIPIVH